MFDFGAGELLVIGVVALVVIGPKELPGVLRQVGKASAKMRQMAGEFRSQFDEAMREAELQDAAKHITGIKDEITRPLADLQNEIHNSAAMLNTPHVPLETASPISALNVDELAAVSATPASTPKPISKSAATRRKKTSSDEAGIPAPASKPRRAKAAPKLPIVASVTPLVAKPTDDLRTAGPVDSVPKPIRSRRKMTT